MLLLLIEFSSCYSDKGEIYDYLRYCIRLICTVLQLLGNDYGISNSMELDFSSSGRVLSFHQAPSSTAWDSFNCCHRGLGTETICIILIIHSFIKSSDIIISYPYAHIKGRGVDTNVCITNV